MGNVKVRDPQYLDGDTDEAKQALFQHIILHEVIHGYMGESMCPHNTDEALIDWIAHMIPKIVKTYDSIINKLKEENADENQD